MFLKFLIFFYAEQQNLSTEPEDFCRQCHQFFSLSILRKHVTRCTNRKRKVLQDKGSVDVTTDES